MLEAAERRGPWFVTREHGRFGRERVREAEEMADLVRQDRREIVLDLGVAHRDVSRSR